MGSNIVHIWEEHTNIPTHRMNGITHILRRQDELAFTYNLEQQIHTTIDFESTSPLPQIRTKANNRSHTHTHTHILIYKCIYRDWTS